MRLAPLDTASERPGIRRGGHAAPPVGHLTLTGARHDTTETMEEKFEAQTRFAIVGSILASLAILALTLAIMGTP